MLKQFRFNFNTIAALAFILLGIVLFVIIPQQVDRRRQAPSSLYPDLYHGLWALGPTCALRKRQFMI